MSCFCISSCFDENVLPHTSPSRSSSSLTSYLSFPEEKDHDNDDSLKKNTEMLPMIFKTNNANKFAVSILREKLCSKKGKINRQNEGVKEG